MDFRDGGVLGGWWLDEGWLDGSGFGEVASYIV